MSFGVFFGIGKTIDTSNPQLESSSGFLEAYQSHSLTRSRLLFGADIFGSNRCGLDVDS